MLSYSLIRKSLELVVTAKNIVKLLKKSIQSLRTVLFSGKNKQGKVNVRRGIYQGDSVSFVTFCFRDSCYNNPQSRKERLNHLLSMDDLKLYGSNDIE